MKINEAYKTYDIVGKLKELERELHDLELALSNTRYFEMGDVHVKDSKNNTVYAFLVKPNDIEPILRTIYSSLSKEKQELLERLDKIC